MVVFLSLDSMPASKHLTRSEALQTWPDNPAGWMSTPEWFGWLAAGARSVLVGARGRTWEGGLWAFDPVVDY